jgi:SAM-dependent methyltransferase
MTALQQAVVPQPAPPACPCCAGTAWRRHAYTAQIHYIECLGCGYHMQQREQVGSAADLRCAFDGEQLKFYGEGSPLASPAYSAMNAEITQRRLRVIGRHLAPGASLIEAGPGSGDVLLALHGLGYRVAAVEHSPVLARRLEQTPGVRVWVGDFAEQSLPEAGFDAYASFHVIEHVVDFAVHLQAARRCVRPGGIALIATPNAAGWEQRLPFRLSPNNDSSHFQLFSPRALERALVAAGWEVVELQTPSYALAWLRLVTKVLRRLRGQDEGATGGAYAVSSSRELARAVRIFSALTLPLRRVQEALRGGNEQFVVARRVR